MSKRSQVVRKLIAKFPAPPELEGVMGGLYDQSDRDAAIIAAAIIENVLERLIKAKFVSRSVQRENAMFSNGGALQNLSAKIQIGAAFGMFSEKFGDDLNRIKDIRNVFAHAATFVDFNTPEIAVLVQDFTAMQVLSERPPSPLENPNFLHEAAKRNFIFAATMAVIMMDMSIMDAGGEPVYADRPRPENGSLTREGTSDKK